ncbi:transposase [Aeribacillus sp. FSL M8-0254]|uniref:transposase n=1 Tax=Aeribacillus sp. FSL M8-0254 TaxID=2954577 RepID=UPI0030F7B830
MLEIGTKKQQKKFRLLTIRSPFKLNPKEKEQVEELLAFHSDLREAYELKNELDVWFKTSTMENCKTGLEAWMTRVEESGNEAFKKVVQTFNRWKQEILQSFMYPFNNGYIEGVNNTTKVIKRMSYGNKSFERLRKKILWRQLIRRNVG